MTKLCHGCAQLLETESSTFAKVTAGRCDGCGGRIGVAYGIDYQVTCDLTPYEAMARVSEQQMTQESCG